MKGVPLRLELGPKDIESGQATLVRRDTSEKRQVPLEGLTQTVAALLGEVQADMLERAAVHRREHTFAARDYEEFSRTANELPGFITAMWCGGADCEQKVKDDLTVTARCIPFEQEEIGQTCVVCGQAAEHMVLWGKAY